MKHPFLIILLVFLVPAFLFTQEGAAGQVPPKKFALVIGNGNYSGLTPLANPVNDANDIGDILVNLGFTVDKILNGSLEEMEEAVMRLKNRLSATENSYGFFFYAGHGVQSNGENYLIPVNANIPGENYLRNRAVSMQLVLDELNDARNSLNVIVLDACRDNPFGWSR
ncbi:MAG: caspase family protein, partial [Treponema sp.]|nr:caspase family protein [Treponema sp.]